MYTPGNGLVSDYVTALAVDVSGKYWIGTQYGLSLFDGENWTTYTKANGLPNNYVTGLAADAANGLWVTTWGGGATYFDGETFADVTTLGLADRVVNSIAEDTAGNIWFATEGGVSRFDGESAWDVYTTLDGLAANDSSAVAVDGQGHVWVGSEQDRYDGAALSGFDGKGWLTYTLRSNTGYSNVAALAVAADGMPWAVAYNPAQFSTTSTLFRLDGDTWHAASEPSPLVDDRVYAFAIEPGGRMWFGTDGSYDSPPLLMHEGEEWAAFDVDGTSHFVRPWHCPDPAQAGLAPITACCILPSIKAALRLSQSRKSNRPPSRRLPSKNRRTNDKIKRHPGGGGWHLWHDSRA